MSRSSSKKQTEKTKNKKKPSIRKKYATRTKPQNEEKEEAFEGKKKG
jgi:hypothetical protein